MSLIETVLTEQIALLRAQAAMDAGAAARAAAAELRADELQAALDAYRMPPAVELPAQLPAVDDPTPIYADLRRSTPIYAELQAEL